MRPGFRLALLGGCVLVAALVSPHTARVLAEDVLGPYALRFDAPDADFAYVSAPFHGRQDDEDFGRDIDGDPHFEAAHDAP